MVNAQQYEYENEESIDKNLRCAICDEPFIDPVSTPCHHCFCRECIRKWLQNYNATCPTCREKLEICSPTPITLLGFLRMLDEIPVKCKLCGQANLQRGNFQDHLTKYCSKTISSSADEDRKASHQSIDEKTRAQSTTSDFELTGYEMIESESATGGTRSTENDSIFNTQRIDSNVVIMQLKSDLKDLSSQDIATASHKAITHQECTLLNLFNHPLLPENLLLIVSALSPRTSLTTLELGKCALEDEGVRLLAENLSDRNSLECLDLYDNSITDVGVDYLSKMLMRNKSLRHLKLSYNQIGDYGMEILAHVLIQNNSTLKRLSVAGNTLIGDGSTDSICSIIRLNQGLKLLNLEDCNISPVDVATILLCKFMSFRLGLDIRS